VSGRACGNCAATLAGRYCASCGQDSQPPETGWASWHDQSQRLVRTVRALLLAPGKLTLEHLGGARVRYIPPFTLFLNAVAVFFLFAVVTRFQLRDIVAQNASWLGPMVEQYAAAAGLAPDVFVQRAERRFQGIYTVALAVVSVAGYTLAYKLLFWRSLPGWRGAFTAALHYLAFIFVFFLPWMLVAHPLRDLVGRATFAALMSVPVALAIAWNSVAARRFAGHGWPVAIAKGIAIVVAGFFIDGLMTLVAIQATFRFS
jgi:hypothetical protein